MALSAPVARIMSIFVRSRESLQSDC